MYDMSVSVFDHNGLQASLTGSIQSLCETAELHRQRVDAAQARNDDTRLALYDCIYRIEELIDVLNKSHPAPINPAILADTLEALVEKARRAL